MLPNVRDGIVQDAIFNPIYGYDAMEQIMSLAEESGFQKEFFENYSSDLEDDVQDDEGLRGFIDGRLGDLFDETGTTVRKVKKIGRNDPCPCGSGKKYKKCCGRNG